MKIKVLSVICGRTPHLRYWRQIKIFHADRLRLSRLCFLLFVVFLRQQIALIPVPKGALSGKWGVRPLAFQFPSGDLFCVNTETDGSALPVRLNNLIMVWGLIYSFVYSFCFKSIIFGIFHCFLVLKFVSFYFDFMSFFHLFVNFTFLQWRAIVHVILRLVISCDNIYSNLVFFLFVVDSVQV